MDARAVVVVVVAGCGSPAAMPDAMVDAVPDPIPPAGLVAGFHLNNALTDIAGNSYMVCGGPFGDFFGDGYHNQGAYMDGVVQYGLIETNHVPRLLDFEGAFTIALWVRPERVPADFEVVASRSFGTGTESSFALVIDSTMRLRYDSQGGASLLGTTPLQIGQWTHVALSYDGTTKRVFANGVIDATGPAAVAVTWDPARTYVIFGADEESSATDAGHHLKGSIDDVMLFDRALDASELAALAAQ